MSKIIKNMKIIKKMKKEFIGQVVKIFPKKGYGFISSSHQKENIYFKVTDNLTNLTENNIVAFVLEEHGANIEAKLVRKVYINNSGIKFMSRVDQTHNHVDLDRFIPIIYDFVKDYKEDFIEKEFTFDFVTGTTVCFPTDTSDNIVYAMRKNRNGHSRFVLDKVPKETKSIFIVLKKTNIGYVIITIYCGKKAPREPFDKLSTAEDLKFWQTHALLFDESNVINGSITTDCPWDVKRFCIEG